MLNISEIKIRVKVASGIAHCTIGCGEMIPQEEEFWIVLGIFSEHGVVAGDFLTFSYQGAICDECEKRR